MRRLLLVVLVALAFAVALVWAGQLGIGPVIVTREGEQKLVLRLGIPVAELTEPGLSLRIPILDEVLVFDARLLYLNSEEQLIQTRDNERLLVDNYVVWRIVDPLAFYQSFPTGRAAAEDRIGRRSVADVRDVIGQSTLDEVLTTRRVEIMDHITRQIDRALESFGVRILGVRINRTELPPRAETNVYARMRTERERLARKLRAEGEEEARAIRADADRLARIEVAEGRRDSQTRRGEGDAEAARIYAEAYTADADFYAFVRSLDAYRKTIGKGTTLVLPPDHEFFEVMGRSGGRGSHSAVPVPPRPEAEAPAAAGDGPP